MDLSMLNKDDITIIGMIFTWLAGVFGLGKIYGLLSSDNKQIKKEVREAKTDIIAIKREFITSEGDQRLMSFAAHEKIQATCQKHMYDRYDSLEKRLDNHDTKLDKILEAVRH